MGFSINEIGSYEQPYVNFGFDRKKVADQIRRMADAIESQKQIGEGGEFSGLQRIETIHSLDHDDYSMTKISFTFATNKKHG